MSSILNSGRFGAADRISRTLQNKWISSISNKFVLCMIMRGWQLDFWYSISLLSDFQLFWFLVHSIWWYYGTLAQSSLFMTLLLLRMTASVWRSVYPQKLICMMHHVLTKFSKTKAANMGARRIEDKGSYHWRKDFDKIIVWSKIEEAQIFV